MVQETNEIHGGNIYKASEHLNIGISDILDFSANINPLGIPEGLRKVLHSSMESLVHYPDPEYTWLRGKLSEYAGVMPENIVPGNGSCEIIFLLLKALKPESILIPAPSFLEYEKASIDAGINIRFMELREEDGFGLNVKQLTREIMSGIKCIIICNPNNPTSVLLTREDIRNIVEIAANYGTTVIVDEAFIELTVGGAGNSVTSLVNNFENLFVIRAFTKIFAVPGLRLGYGIGNKQLVERMQLLRQPWPVSSFAACAGDFLPVSGEYLKRTQDWLKVEKEEVYKSLCSIPGLKVFEPQANFVLAKLPENGIDAAELKESMAGRGILIRNASNFRFLDRQFIRVAVRDRPGNQILVQTLKSLINIKGKSGG